MSTDDRLKALLQGLIDATDQGRAKWTVSESDTYTYRGSKAAVSVGSRDGDGQPPFFFALLDDGSNVVEEITDDDGASGGIALKPYIRALYRSARRNAKSVDSLADSLLADLGDS